MNRQLLVKVHLYLATFLAPIIIIIALSGGLYLFGFKGSTTSTEIYSGPIQFNLSSTNLEADVKALLAELKQADDFEYLKMAGDSITTRPTSKDYFVIKVANGQSTVTLEQPDTIKTLVELHKGHGPQLFKIFQQLTAIGLVFILLSGLWIALKTPPMRSLAIQVTSAGLAAFILFAFIL